MATGHREDLLPEVDEAARRSEQQATTSKTSVRGCSEFPISGTHMRSAGCRLTPHVLIGNPVLLAPRSCPARPSDKLGVPTPEATNRLNCARACELAQPRVGRTQVPCTLRARKQQAAVEWVPRLVVRCRCLKQAPP